MSAQAGRKNRLVSVERRLAGVDSLNQPLDTYELVKKAWANVRGQTGLGSIRAEHTDGVATQGTAYSFRVNYDTTSYDTGMRVNDHGAFYDIVGIRHDHEKREWTDLVCVTGNSDG